MIMAKTATPALTRPSLWLQQVLLVVGASFFVGLCAHVSVPLPFTPVPLTLQNFAVLVVGLALGSRRGFAALIVYLAEGMAGLPVFAGGAAGLAPLLGPSGGYLMMYPLAALAVGLLAEHLGRRFWPAVLACVAGEILLFAGGIAWLALWAHGSWPQAMQFGLYPFVFAEFAKIAAAAGASLKMPRAWS
jgi:biotin transport system substrate-specific component